LIFDRNEDRDGKIFVRTLFFELLGDLKTKNEHSYFDKMINYLSERTIGSKHHFIFILITIK